MNDNPPQRRRVVHDDLTDAEKIAYLEAHYDACWACITAGAQDRCEHRNEARDEMRPVGESVYAFVSTVSAISNAGTSGKPDSVSPIELRLLQAFWDAGLDPVQQYRIGRYTVDFAFPRARLVVEADGHDYHQDADHERQRDEAIRREGWHIVHFSGSVIHQDAEGCVRSVYKLARSSLA